MKSFSKFSTVAATTILSGIIALATNPAQAINLKLINSFDANSPDGITFDPSTGHLFTVETAIVDFTMLNQDGFDLTIRELDITGATINSFTAIDDELVVALGLSLLPNGNLLTSDVIPGRIVEVSSTTGEIVPGGIDIQSPQLSFLTPDGKDPTGVKFNPESNTIISANFVTGDLLEIAPELDSNGDIIVKSVIDLNATVPGIRPSGIEIDPSTGNFLIADDIDGTNAIYEFTPDGQFVSSFDVGALGFEDPEGLALDAATRTLYVSFDDDSLFGQTVTRGNKIAVFKIISVPEPASILSLLALSALGFSSALKGRKKEEEKST